MTVVSTVDTEGNKQDVNPAPETEMSFCHLKTKTEVLFL